MTSSTWTLLKAGYYALVFAYLWHRLGFRQACLFMTWVLAN